MFTRARRWRLRRQRPIINHLVRRRRFRELKDVAPNARYLRCRLHGARQHRRNSETGESSRRTEEPSLANGRSSRKWQRMESPLKILGQKNPFRAPSGPTPASSRVRSGEESEMKIPAMLPRLRKFLSGLARITVELARRLPKPPTPQAVSSGAIR